MYIVQNSQFSADISHNFNLEYVNRPVYTVQFSSPSPPVHCTVCTPTYRSTLYSTNYLQLLQCTQPKSVQSASFPQIVQCLLHPSCPNCTVYSVHFFNDYVYRTRTKKGCITLFSQFIFKLSVTPQYKICS